MTKKLTKMKIVSMRGGFEFRYAMGESIQPSHVNGLPVVCMIFTILNPLRSSKVSFLRFSLVGLKYVVLCVSGQPSIPVISSCSNLERSAQLKNVIEKAFDNRNLGDLTEFDWCVVS